MLRILISFLNNKKNIGPQIHNNNIYNENINKEIWLFCGSQISNNNDYLESNENQHGNK